VSIESSVIRWRILGQVWFVDYGIQGRHRTRIRCPGLIVQAFVTGVSVQESTLIRKENTEYMTINVKPLGDRVLVQPLDEKEVNKGGIIIPDTAKEKPQEGTVAAVGTGKLDDNGKKIEFTVKVGDKVLIPKYGGTEIKIEGENYLILREDDVLGIIG
jgi:chaperonin GroES